MSSVYDKLKGVWQSSYRYPSSGRDGEFTSKHFLRLRREGKHLVFESLPDVNESYVILRLSLDGNVASGSWQEATNPGGYYKGALYYGVIQLIVDEDGNSLSGRWLGFGKDEMVNVGPWELSYVGDSVPAMQTA